MPQTVPHLKFNVGMVQRRASELNFTNSHPTSTATATMHFDCYQIVHSDRRKIRTLDLLGVQSNPNLDGAPLPTAENMFAAGSRAEAHCEPTVAMAGTYPCFSVGDAKDKANGVFSTQLPCIMAYALDQRSRCVVEVRLRNTRSAQFLLP